MASEGHPPRAMPPRIRELRCTVTRIVRETPDTVTLVLDPGASGHGGFEAGQFLSVEPAQFRALHALRTFLEHAKGKREQVRAYSLASPPDQPELELTVKEEPYEPASHPYPPLLSPLLVHGLAPGAELVARGFNGTYVLPADAAERADHVLHVVAGSGSVPSWAIVRWALRHRPTLRHTFVYSSRTWEDVIFRAPLEALAAAHPDRLRVVHCLTREPSPPSGARKGRIDEALLASVLGDPSRTLAFACGPAVTRFERKAAREAGREPAPKFLETVQRTLLGLGLAKDRLRSEAYG